MTLLDRLVPQPKRMLVPPPTSAKAVYGAGYTASLTGVPIGTFRTDDISKTRGALRMMKTAQEAYIANRHIRKAERAIVQRFTSIPWHLEDPEGMEVGTEEGQNNDPRYLEVRRILERPYVPGLGEPAAASPRTWTGISGLTCRHMGISGMGYWFLDQTEQAAHTPRQLLYINPARMTPAQDAKGQLHGWVLDADDGLSLYGGRTGTPLDIEDVLPFYLEEPDRGFLGTGLVASALSLVEITRQSDGHATGVLGSGGRLAGVFSPKGEDIIPPDIYEQMKLDLRNVAEDPNAAKRMSVLRAPIEFTQTAATPEQLDLLGLMNLSAEEVATLWGVPASQLGGEVPTGLNSGGSKGYDEAILFQGPVKGRLDPFRETLQLELLDRWKQIGVDVTLVFEEPEFDDETPMYQRAQMSENLPLDNKERRELLGKDPFGDERDEQIWLPSSLVQVWPAPEPAAPPPGAPGGLEQALLGAGEEQPAEEDDVFLDDSLAEGDNMEVDEAALA